MRVSIRHHIIAQRQPRRKITRRMGAPLRRTVCLWYSAAMLNQLTHVLRRHIVLMLALVVVSISTAACASVPLNPQSGAATVGAQAARPSVTSTREPLATGIAAKVTAAATRQATVTATPKERAAKQPSATATPRPRATKQPTATPTAPPARRATSSPDDGLPTVAQARLPREARETIRLIERGGPFPYDRDGATFQNREGLLPKQPSGYYREYTVITPGSSDRGARRIIAGKGGELYYTDDHYDSFKRVIP